MSDLDEMVNYHATWCKSVINCLLNPTELDCDCGRDNAVKELADLRKRTEWRPIETAPINKKILVRRNDGFIRSITFDDQYHRGGWVQEFEHWMPLPKPPEEQK